MGNIWFDGDLMVVLMRFDGDSMGLNGDISRTESILWGANEGCNF
jgi:hypothetical protein